MKKKKRAVGCTAIKVHRLFLVLPFWILRIFTDTTESNKTEYCSKYQKFVERLEANKKTE